MTRNSIYEALEGAIKTRTSPPLKGLQSHLLDLDLALSAAKMTYYDSGQSSAEAIRYIFVLAMAAVFALEAHGLPAPDELSKLPLRS